MIVHSGHSILDLFGGGGGIRTLGTRFHTYSGLANRRTRPLCDPSASKTCQIIRRSPHPSPSARQIFYPRIITKASVLISAAGRFEHSPALRNCWLGLLRPDRLGRISQDWVIYLGGWGEEDRPEISAGWAVN